VNVALKRQFFNGKDAKEAPEAKQEDSERPPVNCVCWAGYNDNQDQFAYVDDAGTIFHKGRLGGVVGPEEETAAFVAQRVELDPDHMRPRASYHSTSGLWRTGHSHLHLLDQQKRRPRQDHQGQGPIGTSRTHHMLQLPQRKLPRLWLQRCHSFALGHQQDRPQSKAVCGPRVRGRVSRRLRR
jgi:hypothetical protein